MAKVKLSKGALAQQRTQLKLYERLLPSLDLKRRQLTVEHGKSRAEQARLRAEVDDLDRRIGAELPMLASTDIDLSKLVRMTGVQLDQENVVGVRVPVLEKIECEVSEYALLGRPAWVDLLVKRLKQAAEARVSVQVAEQREVTFAGALRRVTQRVNLFDKILIPRAKENIRRIQIFLGDLEREAVVRAKLAKSKEH